MKKMATGVFRLKGSKLQELSREKGVKNVHRISMHGGVSYPTVLRYFEKSEEVEAVSSGLCMGCW